MSTDPVVPYSLDRLFSILTHPKHAAARLIACDGRSEAVAGPPPNRRREPIVATAGTVGPGVRTG